MNEAPLDPEVDAFRTAGDHALDWIASYFRNTEKFPVLPKIAPGEITKRLSRPLSERGQSYEELFVQFEREIVPGVTLWNHPGFMAYFAITGSPAGVLGELLIAALNNNGMLWKSNPAGTELELLVLERLREAMGLPAGLFGIINDTASINTFLALAAARESVGLSIRQEGMTGRSLPRLRIYCSEQAHSSVEKAALALGLGAAGIRMIETDEAFRMSPDALQKAIAEDRRKGVLPCAITATLGTTSTAAVDPLEEIGTIAAAEDVWLHVDAAYAGSATIDPAHRWIWKGIERADSIVTNPHKWLFTPIDCAVLYLRDPDTLKETFSLVPEYLKTGEADVINYMDYGLQLGRRFRSLKLWLVLEHYGLEKLRSVINQHIEYARRLARILQQRDDIELLAPQSFSVVVFRKVGEDKLTADLLERINASGKLFLSHTKLRGKLGIRVAIGNGATQWRHVEQLLEFL